MTETERCLSDATTQRRSGAGRPRQFGLDEQITASAARLLLHRPYGEISIEAIAQDAGVGKASIYRRWPHKAALMVDVLLQQALAMQVPLSAASYREHLVAGLRGLRDLLSSHFSQAIIAIISEAQHNESLRQRFYDGFISGMQALGDADLAIAIERGEVRADIDKELVFDQLVGLFYYRLLMVKKPLDDNTIERIVDGVMKQLEE